MVLVMLRFLFSLCLVMPSVARATTVNVGVPSFSMSLVAFMAARREATIDKKALTLTSCS